MKNVKNESNLAYAMNTIRTVTVKKGSIMKVKNVRRQKSDDRRQEVERKHDV